MIFNTTDETEHFGYNDAKITKAELGGEDIVLEVEALIVKPENSCNEQFTASYAGTAVMTFAGGQVTGAFLEGYKRYDANENLVSVMPDTPLADPSEEKLVQVLKDSYLTAVVKKGGEYILRLESTAGFPTDDVDAPSFLVHISCAHVTIGWDRYMNRVPY